MKNNIPFSSRVVIISLFVILFSVLFSLANAIYNNYQHELKVQQFENENERYREDIKVKMYEYLRSQLKRVLEKEKKETMNLINPGEEVIVIHEEGNKGDLFQSTEEEKSFGERKLDRYRNKSNPEKWWYFFFD